MKKHESIRLFKNPFLESLTHVHPIIPLILWGPFVVFLIYQGIEKIGWNLSILGMFSFGLLIWTLSEYLLHRFVFHFPGKSKVSKRFVYLFHGLHHDDPSDPTRLVMPPVPAILIMFLLYQFFALLISPTWIEIFMAGFTAGYLTYDYIHYATHHFPMKGKIGKYLKRYHLRHHYAHEASKYGVSSPLWDYVFGTVSVKKPLTVSGEKEK